MTTFKGVLFDFDGTLADTMENHYLAWRSALAEYNIFVQACDYYPLEGMSLFDIALRLTKESSFTRSALDDLIQRKKSLYLAHQSLRFYPGVRFLIRWLKSRQISMGIVTAGDIDQLTSSVPKNFLGNFDVIVTGDQVSHGKPHPEPYLRGARGLGLQPHECISVENAPLGVQSAKQAGTYCIAICSTVGRDALSAADEIVDRFQELHSRFGCLQL